MSDIEEIEATQEEIDAINYRRSDVTVCPSCGAEVPLTEWALHLLGHSIVSADAGAQLAKLAERFKTVWVYYNDSGVIWQVGFDWQRRTFAGCRVQSMGDTVEEAIREAVKMAGKLEENGTSL